MKLHTTTSIRSSSRRPFRARTRFMVAAVSGCFAAGVLANPVGPSVVAGTASIAQIGKTMTVTNSAGAILNWNQFSIAAGETTRFIQPTASSAVLNRVLGADPSQIYGTLSSNGKVWLINPAGILVGASGRVDTAGLVAEDGREALAHPRLVELEQGLVVQQEEGHLRAIVAQHHRHVGGNGGGVRGEVLCLVA